jgi:hypothetical protein
MLTTLKTLITAMDPGADYFITFEIDHSRTSLAILSGEPGPLAGWWVVKSQSGLICWDQFTNIDLAKAERDRLAREDRTLWNFIHYNLIRRSRILVNIAYWIAVRTRATQAV